MHTSISDQPSDIFRWNIFYSGPQNDAVDVDALLTAISKTFNVATIAEDCYEIELRQRKAVLERLEVQGKVFRHKETLLGDVERKKSVYGEGKTVKVQASGEITFDGVVCEKQILLQWRGPDHAEVENVANSIRGIVESFVRHPVTVRRFLDQ